MVRQPAVPQTVELVAVLVVDEHEAVVDVVLVHERRHRVDEVALQLALGADASQLGPAERHAT